MVSLSTVGWDAHGWIGLSHHPDQTWAIPGPYKALLMGKDWSEPAWQGSDRKASPRKEYPSSQNPLRGKSGGKHFLPRATTAWPSTGGLWLPLFIHPCAGSSVGRESSVSLWEKSPLSLTQAPGEVVLYLCGSLFPWVHLAAMRNKPVAAAPGQEQPEAAASQPKLIQGVREQKGTEEQRAALAQSSFNLAMVNAGFVLYVGPNLPVWSVTELWRQRFVGQLMD